MFSTPLRRRLSKILSLGVVLKIRSVHFDTLKTSAYASAKINLGDELDMDDLVALFAVNDYFQQRLGHSVFSSIEVAGIGDALEKHGIIFVEAQ